MPCYFGSAHADDATTFHARGRLPAMPPRPPGRAIAARVSFKAISMLLPSIRARLSFPRPTCRRFTRPLFAKSPYYIASAPATRHISSRITAQPESQRRHELLNAMTSHRKSRGSWRDDDDGCKRRLYFSAAHFSSTFHEISARAARAFAHAGCTRRCSISFAPRSRVSFYYAMMRLRGRACRRDSTIRTASCSRRFHSRHYEASKDRRSAASISMPRAIRP